MLFFPKISQHNKRVFVNDISPRTWLWKLVPWLKGKDSLVEEGSHGEMDGSVNEWRSHDMLWRWIKTLIIASKRYNMRVTLQFELAALNCGAEGRNQWLWFYAKSGCEQKGQIIKEVHSGCPAGMGGLKRNNLVVAISGETLSHDNMIQMIAYRSNFSVSGKQTDETLYVGWLICLHFFHCQSQ